MSAMGHPPTYAKGVIGRRRSQWQVGERDKIRKLREKRTYRPFLLLSPALVSLLLLILAPLILIFVYSFWLRTADGRDIPAFQFDNWQTVLSDPFYWQGLAGTFALSGVTTLICAVLGYPTAYFLARCRFHNKSLLLFLLFLPFWISIVIRTLAWINVLGREGFINAALMALGVIHAPLNLLYNDFSVIMGLVYLGLPYMIINVYVSLDGIDRNLEAAAKTLGCTPWQNFRAVTLPLSLPGLGAGCLLSFILSAGSFVTPSLLGGADTSFFTQLIYDATIDQLDWPTGSVLSLLLLTALGLVVATYNRFMSLNDVYRSFAK
ncbi:MAG TPA: ABC transporter permease [Terriglobales bacterium]|nr:ABC transporter permease [Terriglobales bacterium]